MLLAARNRHSRHQSALERPVSRAAGGRRVLVAEEYRPELRVALRELLDLPVAGANLEAHRRERITDAQHMTTEQRQIVARCVSRIVGRHWMDCRLELPYDRWPEEVSAFKYFVL